MQGPRHEGGACFAPKLRQMLPGAQGSIANWMQRKERTDEKEVIGRESRNTRRTNASLQWIPTLVKLQDTKRG